MSEETIVRHCAPTLAGIKPASLFTYIYTEESENLVESLRKINKRMRAYGLRMIPLRSVGAKGGRSKCLLYLYRPKELADQIYADQGKAILSADGYACRSLDTDLCTLIRRFSEGEEFPHEIGLFLGYPPEDVQGFIDNKGKHYKLCGTWKVYGDEKKACRQFDRYRNCTSIYCDRIANGAGLDSLIVAEKTG